MLSVLWSNKVEAAAIILFGIGFTTLLLNRNLIRKIIGFSFMDSAIFLFLAAGDQRYCHQQRTDQGKPSYGFLHFYASFIIQDYGLWFQVLLLWFYSSSP